MYIIELFILFLMGIWIVSSLELLRITLLLVFLYVFGCTDVCQINMQERNCYGINKYQFSSVQLLSRVWLFVTPWIAARQASLSITNSQSSLRLTSIESVMPSSHLILCCPLLLLPPIPPNIRVFSNESTFRMRWPKDWSFSFSF